MNFKIILNHHRFRWLKKFGFWGILFFTVKGLLWLIVPAVLIYFGVECE